MDWSGSAGVAWLAAAVALAAIELLVPGVFLIFLAVAAAITGAATLLLPGMTLGLELLSFAAWSIVAVLIGKRWYRDYPVETTDPLLNDRVARLVGEVVTVSEAFENGRGRVRLGDSEWPARGDDAPLGARVRITGGQSGVLSVAPAPALSPSTE
jgi:inner membrane protein